MVLFRALSLTTMLSFKLAIFVIPESNCMSGYTTQGEEIVYGTSLNCV